MTFTLPNVSDALSSLTLPVSNKNITMRPMIVADIKALAISAKQSSDPIGMYKTAISILNKSIVEDIKIEKMASADLEMAFLKLKSISSGDVETYNITCGGCKTQNPVEINFETDPFISTEEVLDPHITLLNGATPVGVNMTNFTYESLLKYSSNKKMDDVDKQFEIIKGCVVSIFDGDNIILREDIDAKDFDAWFNTLNVKQIQMISNYIDSLPTVQIQIKSTCTKCKEVIEESVKGLSDFLV